MPPGMFAQGISQPNLTSAHSRDESDAPFVLNVSHPPMGPLWTLKLVVVLFIRMMITYISNLDDHDSQSLSIARMHLVRQIQFIVTIR